jgi:hypothetical protein
MFYGIRSSKVSSIFLVDRDKKSLATPAILGVTRLRTFYLLIL